MQKSDILGILEYSKPFQNYVPTHIQDPVIFTRTYEYWELWHLKPDTKWSFFFAKIVKNYNYFSKTLHLRSLTEFWIHYPSISTNELLERSYNIYCMIRIQYPAIFTSCSDIFNHIVAYLEPCVIRAYSEPCHVQNPGIFRTQDICRILSRHILGYSVDCPTFAFWKPCHIQNIAILRILAFLGLQAYSESSCLLRHI